MDTDRESPISAVVIYFPTLMGNLLNQVYSITDSIVVGGYLERSCPARSNGHHALISCCDP